MKEYKDGKVEKKTMVTETDEKGKVTEVEKVQTYTPAEIDNGIATCERILKQLEIEKPYNYEGNIKAVQAEKDWWLECKGLIPVVEEVFKPLEEIDKEIEKEIEKEELKEGE